MNLPSALVYSTRLRVSVYGTGCFNICLAVFLGSGITRAITKFRGIWCTLEYQLLRWICLPQSTPKFVNALFRQGAAVSLLRHHIALKASHGILTVSTIAFAVRLRLRTRLTPG